MCGVSLKDKFNDVTERCGLKEDVVARVERGMLWWFGHLERTNDKGVTKQIYRENVCGGKIAERRRTAPAPSPRSRSGVFVRCQQDTGSAIRCV
ncbi:hypothetical protein EVAR_15794_1 [Eumeta japonica]|uniref:Uncharacterized protein n=1 Tax=Eumeta variegata TaxID=151549 RepID=A0A4C1U0V6_EUMVA|nr:hypothetical protein EVAR_15794_1 [Eumeta japonica]